MSETDWRVMGRDAFDHDARTVQLAIEACPVAEPGGTGDLFDLLPEEAS